MRSFALGDSVVMRKSRILAHSFAGVLLVLAPTIVAARPAAAAPSGLTPIFECSFKLTNGSGYQTAWGYDNETGQVQTIPAGTDNGFRPSPRDRGQPTKFLTGRHDNVLVLSWDGSSRQSWRISTGFFSSQSAAANKSSVCASTPVPVTGTGVSEIVAVLVVAAFSVGLLRFLRNRDARKANR